MGLRIGSPMAAEVIPQVSTPAPIPIDTTATVKQRKRIMVSSPR